MALLCRIHRHIPNAAQHFNSKSLFKNSSSLYDYQTPSDDHPGLLQYMLMDLFFVVLGMRVK
jgi:hypothetical protein